MAAASDVTSTLQSISSTAELNALVQAHSNSVVLLSFWTRWSQPSLHTLEVVTALAKQLTPALVVAKVLSMNASLAFALLIIEIFFR